MKIQDSHSFGKPPVRQSLSAHLGGDFLPGTGSAQTHTRSYRRGAWRVLPRPPEFLSRVPQNCYGPKFHPTSPINPLSLIRYSVYTRVSACSLISVNVQSGGWCVLDEYYIRMFLSFVFLLFPSSVLIERGKRKVKKKRNKAGGVSHDGRDVMHLR